MDSMEIAVQINTRKKTSVTGRRQLVGYLQSEGS